MQIQMVQSHSAKKSNKFSYKLTLSQAEININNSQKNTWSDEYFRYLGADLNVNIFLIN